MAGRARFFVAARGHHADIGGITPGSMPPFSRDISEEGVLFDGVRMVHRGKFDEAAMRAVLSGGRISRAQSRPEHRGSEGAGRGLRERCGRTCAGPARNMARETVTAYMRHVQDNAEESVRRVIGALKDGAFKVPMDGGAEICVKVTVDRAARSAKIDFTGTTAQAAEQFQRAAIGHQGGGALCVPLSGRGRHSDECGLPEAAGDHRAGRIAAQSANRRAQLPAGNVETSQAVVDALFGALGVMAAAQGTMNNLTFGNARHQYYETICGGAGAGADFDGQSAVQTHMTNSRLTDPEVLETRYPVIVEEFSIRRGSGGEGAHKGGDGVVRRIRFREAMTAGILSTRRQTDPFGLDGGKPGARGANWVTRRDGARTALKGCDETAVAAGDSVTIETPGGGGFGLIHSDKTGTDGLS